MSYHHYHSFPQSIESPLLFVEQRLRLFLCFFFCNFFRNYRILIFGYPPVLLLLLYGLVLLPIPPGIRRHIKLRNLKCEMSSTGLSVTCTCFYLRRFTLGTLYWDMDNKNTTDRSIIHYVHRAIVVTITYNI